jgi:hypothetical protein
LHLVLEDDAYLLPTYLENFKKILQCQSKTEWDIIFTGISSNDDTSSEVTLKPVSSITPVLPCKESYFIKPKVATSMLGEWKTLKFILRIQWSYWLKMNPNIKAMYPTKRAFIDGSKVGVMPSSLHANNPLIFNREYFELSKIVNSSEEEAKTKTKEVEALYGAVANLNSPDIMHLLATFLLKIGKVMEAKAVLQQAINIMNVHSCTVRSQGDLYQALVTLHEKLQHDVPTYVKLASKYENEAMALSDA